MQLPRNAVFDEEAVRFRLVFACEDCGNFDAGRERCRHEWPTELHRRGHVAADVVFCKEFEIQ